MAGLMSRTALIIKSKYSALLNRTENPTQTLDYSYEQMLEQLQNVKRGIADVVTAKKRIELQQQKLEQNVVKLETQARQAVAANREDSRAPGARAQGRRQQQLQGMDGQVTQLEQPAAAARRLAAALQSKIESFRSQKEILKAQYSAAEAQVKVGEAATGIGKSMQDTGLAIERAKDKTERDAGARSAIDELTSRRRARGLHHRRPDSARPRARADLLDAQVDDELAKLKAEVGSGDAQKEIAAGDASLPPRGG
jgi:phage shock protein A